MADGRNGWSIETVREHLLALLHQHENMDERRHESQAQALEAARMATQMAIDKAEIAMERRFESINEFRESLSDQTRTYMPRAEYEAKHVAITAQIDSIDKRLTLAEGRSSGIQASWAVVIAVVTIALAGLGAVLIITH